MTYSNEPILTADQIAERVRGMAEALDIAAYVERDLRLRAEKAEKERDNQKARADRNHHERTSFRVENDALRAEVARLTVAKLPTAADYDRIIKERDEARASAAALLGHLSDAWDAAVGAGHRHGTCAEHVKDLRARCVAAEAEVARLADATESMVVDYGQMQIKVDEAERGRDFWREEVNRLREEQKYDLNKNTLAWKDFDTLKANVDAAFNTLGKRDTESYEACAARIMDGVEALRKERAAVTRTAYKDFDTLHAHVVRTHGILGTPPGESLEDSAKRVVKERDGMFACAAERAARIDDLEEERDAARAELAKVREALGTLMNEGKKAP